MGLIRSISSTTWLRIALINFLLVGLLGLLMRLKMILPMPWINQKFLLHAHSHFAFTGWVTHALMVLVLVVVARQWNLTKKGQWLVLANIFTAYGMLVTFMLQGYALYSITFSTLNILVSFFFAAYVWNLTKNQWFRMAVFLLVFSSIGTFFLSYLMVTHNLDSRKQLAAVYFYLHFQYNGWFLFACLGLLHSWLKSTGITMRREKMLYTVTALASIPTYFLSVLWWKDMPTWLYVVVVVVTLAQLVAWFIWLIEFSRKFPVLNRTLSKLTAITLLVVGAALSIKVVLQALSLVPELSQLAYGYRPIVIGYLHLILLMVISLFIVAYLIGNHVLRENKWVRIGMYVTISGIVLNELLLMVQGLSGMLRVYVPYTAQGLAGASVVICLGLLIVCCGQYQKKSPVSTGDYHSF